MEVETPANARRARMRAGSQSARSKACGKLPLLSSGWCWTPGASWIVWEGARVDSLLDRALLRPVVWSCWTRTLDTLGVDHGGRGVIPLSVEGVDADHAQRLLTNLERIEQLGGALKEGVEATLMMRLVTDLATMQGERAARAQLGAGVCMLGERAGKLIRAAISAERDLLEQDLVRAHLLGDVKEAGH